MSASDAEERDLLDDKFGSGTPTTWHVGLSTTTPGDDGSNFTEPTGGSYTRVAYTNNGTNFPGASTTNGITTTKNGTAITFTNPTADWGTVIEWGFFDVSSGGLPKYTNPLDDDVTIASGNTPVQFGIGAFVLPCD